MRHYSLHKNVPFVLPLVVLTSWYGSSARKIPGFGWNRKLRSCWAKSRNYTQILEAGSGTHCSHGINILALFRELMITSSQAFCMCVEDSLSPVASFQLNPSGWIHSGSGAEVKRVWICGSMGFSAARQTQKSSPRGRMWVFSSAVGCGTFVLWRTCLGMGMHLVP